MYPDGWQRFKYWCRCRTGSKCRCNQGERFLSGGWPCTGNGFGLLAENCTVTISGARPHRVCRPARHLSGKGSITLSDTPTIQAELAIATVPLSLTDGGCYSAASLRRDDNGLFVQGSTSTVTLSGGAYQGGNKAIAIESNTALTVASFLGLGSGYL